ncbi:MAG: 3-phosphoserine/phosphohydroxythreonine transaminase [Verrucomicrobia bacterium]|nr:3-phosphoserine/phosphohydroxythreonine transaminase [Verrucomicrobiota bacterium]
MSRAYNFSAGPATLPLPVLEQARADMVDYQGMGMSLIESSHRDKPYMAIHDEALANVRELLNLGDDHEVVLLQGGATAQFAMIPMNLLVDGAIADYTASGAWATKAIEEARRIGTVHIAADCGDAVPTRVPHPDELNLTPDAAYVHLTSNETISGAQWKRFPKTEAPLVADMSSDILSRPFTATDFGLIYAGAQKNLGPSGVTLVIIRKDLVERAPASIPAIFTYREHIKGHSMLNTPPCFAIYLLALVTRWIKATGLATIHERNTAKAAALYAAIDATDFYTGTAATECRSDMNVTFGLANADLEPAFIKAAEANNLKGLKGHRSVGGLRASIYNAFPVEGVDALIGFMKEFEAKHG